MKKILIVDDEVVIRETLATFLQNTYEVFLAGDGAEALIVFNEQKLDLIISDVNMPIMTGDEMAREIFIQDPNLPIIIISGIDINKDKEYPASVIKFFEKPFKVKDIMSVIKSKLEFIESPV